MSAKRARPTLERHDNWVVCWLGRELRFYEDRAEANRFHAALDEVVQTANAAIDDTAWVEKRPTLEKEK